MEKYPVLGTGKVFIINEAAEIIKQLKPGPFTQFLQRNLQWFGSIKGFMGTSSLVAHENVILTKTN